MAESSNTNKPIEATEYNTLLQDIKDADAQLRGADRDAWLRDTDLQALLRANPSYTLTLVHRHHILNDGERMVSVGPVTKPEKGTENDSRVVESSWTSEGRAYEWTRLGQDEVAPEYPAQLIKGLGDFFNKRASAKRDNTAKAREVLGISRAQEGSLSDTQVWWEVYVDADRSHRLSRKEGADIADGDYRTAWVPPVTVSKKELDLYMACCGVCHHAESTVTGKN